MTRVADDHVHLDGTGQRKLYLPAAPVEPGSLTVTLDGAPVTPDSIHYRSGMIGRDAGWPEGASIDVTYTHGYAEAPGDVQDVVLERAQALLESGAITTSAEAGGAQSISYFTAALVGNTAAWTAAVSNYSLAARA